MAAVVADLAASTAIQKAGKIIISGGSAGASAVYYHADFIKEALDAGPTTQVPTHAYYCNCS